MATAALFLGVGAMVTFWTVYLPMVFGGLGIILAILSMGFERKLYSQARTAIAFSAIGLVISFAIIFTTIVGFLQNPNTLMDIARQYDMRFMQTYGQSSDEVMGNSYENMLQQFYNMLR